MSQAVVVKHWGIWPVTWKCYLLGLGIQTAALAGLYAIWLLLPWPLPPLASGEDWLTVLLVQGVVANAGWILLAFATYTVVDAAVMMSLFGAKWSSQFEQSAN